MRRHRLLVTVRGGQGLWSEHFTPNRDLDPLERAQGGYLEILSWVGMEEKNLQKT